MSIEKQLAILIETVNGVKRDVTALRAELSLIRAEYRESLAELRGDLALISSRQNDAINVNKKKSGRLTVRLPMLSSD